MSKAGPTPSSCSSGETASSAWWDCHMSSCDCVCGRCLNCSKSNSADAKLSVDDILVYKSISPGPAVSFPYSEEQQGASAKFKLNWLPNLGVDLDSQLVFDNTRIDYNKKKDQGAFLNVDTNKGEVGETIYLESLLPNAIYSFSVDNYAGGDLQPAAAWVEIFDSKEISLGKQYSPFWSKNLQSWHVFDYKVSRTEAGNITTTIDWINKIE